MVTDLAYAAEQHEASHYWTASACGAPILTAFFKKVNIFNMLAHLA
jgi:hypothetical protein